MINIPVPGKKSSNKPKSAKKGDDSSKACSDVVPFGSGHTCSSVCSTANKSKLISLRLSTGAPPSSRTRGNKRKTFSLPTSITTERRVRYL